MGSQESDTTERLSTYTHKDKIGKGNSNPLQYFWLGNPMDRGAWRATVYRIAKSQTQLE